MNRLALLLCFCAPVFTGDTTGFVVHAGVATSFYVPGYQNKTFSTGTNDLGQVVGYPPGSPQTTGFLRLSGGSCAA